MNIEYASKPYQFMAAKAVLKSPGNQATKLAWEDLSKKGENRKENEEENVLPNDTKETTDER